MTTQTTFKADFLIRWDNACKYTIAVAEAMPEALYSFRAHEDMKSFAGILVHTGQGIYYLAGQVQPLKTPRYEGSMEDKAAIIDYLKTAYAKVREFVEQAPDSLWGEMGEFWAGEASVQRLMNLGIDHVTHHRGQATVYLRMNGIKPPRYIGW